MKKIWFVLVVLLGIAFLTGCNKGIDFPSSVKTISPAIRLLTTPENVEALATQVASDAKRPYIVLMDGETILPLVEGRIEVPKGQVSIQCFPAVGKTLYVKSPSELDYICEEGEWFFTVEPNETDISLWIVWEEE